MAARNTTGIECNEVAGGAGLTYRTAGATLATALHSWFDAQVSAHGPDAMAGLMHHDLGSMMQQ